MSDIKTPPKKLVDLNPQWFEIHGRDTLLAGVIYDCPCQLDTCAWGGRVAISFSNPVRGEPANGPGERLWHRTGETFETLTLSPSVHQVGHWHGWIRNGVVESC